MRRMITGVLVATLAGLAVSCDDTPTGPTSQVVFTAQLSPANENPPVANAESTGSGTVTITFDVTRDAAGTITGAVAGFQVSLTGFPAGTALTMAHIHVGPVGTNGVIVVDTGLTAGQVTLVNGSGAFNRSGIAVGGVLAQDIATNPGSYYFNVHSVLNGTGMARGQLRY